jgi:hypothetical protein
MEVSVIMASRPSELRNAFVAAHAIMSEATPFELQSMSLVDRTSDDECSDEKGFRANTRRAASSRDS